MQAGTPQFCSVISDSAQSIVKEKKKKKHIVYSYLSATPPLVTLKEPPSQESGWKSILDYTFKS